MTKTALSGLDCRKFKQILYVVSVSLLKSGQTDAGLGKIRLSDEQVAILEAGELIAVPAKRRKYEQMDTVQEIVFVDPLEKEVIVCRRTEQVNVWTETLYNVPSESINMDGFQIPLSDIFANLPE